ncbi:hypothetical protein RRG08_048667 [Elysia crispata]|uniref:Uncharacterized protein n=1 Tax=Elysia crispata TaxID=231223 RepID=A0AAE1DXU8_9GAST|nr:hypothetical protein RRG08_048667 [Elysia crispata]
MHQHRFSSAQLSPTLKLPKRLKYVYVGGDWTANEARIAEVGSVRSLARHSSSCWKWSLNSECHQREYLHSLIPSPGKSQFSVTPVESRHEREGV